MGACQHGNALHRVCTECDFEKIVNLECQLEIARRALEFYAHPLYEASRDNPELRIIPESEPGKVAIEALDQIEKIGEGKA